MWLNKLCSSLFLLNYYPTIVWFILTGSELLTTTRDLKSSAIFIAIPILLFGIFFTWDIIRWIYDLYYESSGVPCSNLKDALLSLNMCIIDYIPPRSKSIFSNIHLLNF